VEPTQLNPRGLHLSREHLKLKRKILTGHRVGTDARGIRTRKEVSKGVGRHDRGGHPTSCAAGALRVDKARQQWASHSVEVLSAKCFAHVERCSTHVDGGDEGE
jgi:hypothetical protein